MAVVSSRTWHFDAPRVVRGLLVFGCWLAEASVGMSQEVGAEDSARRPGGGVRVASHVGVRPPLDR
jgi:hypothetical protein